MKTLMYKGVVDEYSGKEREGEGGVWYFVLNLRFIMALGIKGGGGIFGSKRVFYIYIYRTERCVCGGSHGTG